MGQLSPEESKRLLKKYNIRVADSEVAETKTQAIRIAKKYGFPIVLKIVSPDIIHKTEAKGVRVGIFSTPEVQETFDEIERNAKRYKKGVRIDGILVQKQAEGKEIIIGGKRDPQFGPVVLFGLGGVFVETMKDVSIRVAPVNRSEALKMIKEIKGYPILEGARGEKGVNIEKIVSVISRVSNLMMDEDDVVEMDLNPCFVNEKECIVGDIRILIKGK